MIRASKPLSPNSRTISIAVPSGRWPKISRATLLAGCAMFSPHELNLRANSILESFDVVAPAEHEGVRHMDQRRQIDIRNAIGDQLGEVAVERRIFRLLAIDTRALAVNQPAAAGPERQPSGVGLDVHVPDLRTGLTPVEFGPNRHAGLIGKGKIG